MKKEDKELLKKIISQVSNARFPKMDNSHLLDCWQLTKDLMKVRDIISKQEKEIEKLKAENDQLRNDLEMVGSGF